MRLGVVGLAVAVAAGPAYGQRNRDNTGAVDRACSVTDCFLERDVRDFEVIDRTHLILYIGSQRCAFHVELIGTACDMTFAPELYFRKLNEVPYNLVSSGFERPGEPSDVQPRITPGIDPLNPFELERREQLQHDLRVCSNDLTVQVHGGQFTETNSASMPTDRFGNPRTDCRVSSVEAITDDQLIELYVARGVTAPPPPMGTGEIEIGEQPEQGAAPTPSSDGADEEGR